MRFSEKEKAMRLEDWRRSGKSAWAYAKENGLCPQTFGRWTKTKSKSTHGFVELPKELILPQKNYQVILIEKGEMKIHIPLTLGCGELRTIFSALGEMV